MAIGDFTIGKIIPFRVEVHDENRAAVDADTPPTWSLYDQTTGTAVATGAMAKFASKTGFYSGSIDSAALTRGHLYTIYIEVVQGGNTGIMHQDFTIEMLAEIAGKVLTEFHLDEILDDDEIAATIKALLFRDVNNLLEVDASGRVIAARNDGNVAGSILGSIVGNIDGAVLGGVAGELAALSAAAVAQVLGAALAALFSTATEEPTGPPTGSAPVGHKIGWLFNRDRFKGTSSNTEDSAYNSAGQRIGRAAVSDQADLTTREAFQPGP